MAEEQDGKKRMRCKSLIKLHKIMKDDIQKYTEIISNKAKVLEGDIYPCCHTDEMDETLSDFKALLKMIQDLNTNHVHVVERRSTPGRKKVKKPSLLPDDRDSGTSSISSKELRRSAATAGATNSTRDGASTQQSFNIQVSLNLSDNIATETRNSQLNADSQKMNDKSQTYKKTAHGNSRPQEPHPKDDLSEKEKADTDSSDG